MGRRGNREDRMHGNAERQKQRLKEREYQIRSGPFGLPREGPERD